MHLKNIEKSINLPLTKITRAIAGIIHALIVIKQYAKSKEIDNGLNLPQNVNANCETEPDIIKSMKTKENSDHYIEAKNKNLKSGYGMHKLNLKCEKKTKEKDIFIGKNQAPRNQNYVGPTDANKNEISYPIYQIEKVARDFSKKVIEENANGVRKMKINTGKKFYCLNEENETISVFNCLKENTYKFEFEDKFFANPKAEKIITGELWHLHDQSSDKNTFYKQENITAIFYNRRRLEEKNISKIFLALCFSKNKIGKKRFIECAVVFRKECNIMKAYSNSTEAQFQKLKMIKGGVYGNCGYNGELSNEEFEHKNLILWIIKYHISVGDVKLSWRLETAGVYSENTGNIEGIEQKYNFDMTILDHPLQKDGEDSCLPCAYLLIALHFKKQLYPGIIKSNTSLEKFLNKIKLGKPRSLPRSRLDWYNRLMETKKK